ncbi:MAG: hypothetical protein IIU55_04230 [Paludibacteraceae bacterium]|nr:hypothetical protein [Paludibacteraceae bacterium]
MKKKFFIAISVVSVFAMGMLMVACTSKSNSLNPNEDVAFEESVQQVKETSSDEWEAFYAAVDELNSKYFPKNNLAKYVVASDDVEVDEEMKEIVRADALGAALGLLGGSTWQERIVSAVINAAVESYKEATNSDCQVTTNSLIFINDLDHSSVGVVVGQQHNAIVHQLMSDNFAVSGLTRQEIMTVFVQTYEELYFPINSTFRRALINGTLRMPALNTSVQRANNQFDIAASSLSISVLHDYTEEYLSVVDRTISNENDKSSIQTYACQTYYSSALWVVQ